MRGDVASAATEITQKLKEKGISNKSRDNALVTLVDIANIVFAAKGVIGDEVRAGYVSGVQLIEQIMWTIVQEMSSVQLRALWTADNSALAFKL